MKRILIAFGTRPEAIKMCPLIKELKKRRKFDIKVLVSGQHSSMLSQAMEAFGVTADYDLRIMKIGQTLFDITEAILERAGAVIEELLPDVVLVHGDTTTAFAVALASFYLRIPVGHIEAGLRSGDVYSPYPEEFNRHAISLIAEYHFAPTEQAKENLLKEGREEKRVFVVGNTVIDALISNVRDDYHHRHLPTPEKRLILFTAHRRENLDDGMEDIFKAVRRIAEDFDSVRVVYPIHKNERIRKLAAGVFSGTERVDIIEPLNVTDFHNFLNRCYFVITDSGGIQEEASYLGKPTLVARKKTERKELLSFSCTKLVSTEENGIYEAMKKLLIDGEYYKKCAVSQKIFGSGKASKKIADILEKEI